MQQVERSPFFRSINKNHKQQPNLKMSISLLMHYILWYSILAITNQWKHEIDLLPLAYFNKHNRLTFIQKTEFYSIFFSSLKERRVCIIACFKKIDIMQKYHNDKLNPNTEARLETNTTKLPRVPHCKHISF